ncbi:hypothetical protein GCM10027589_36260 [Actinocorallia lasiicapitis]
MTQTDIEDQELVDLGKDWPDWRFWRTDAGTVMATRRRILSTDEVDEGLARTLPMGIGRSGQLVAQLAAQAHIEKQLSDGT